VEVTNQPTNRSNNQATNQAVKQLTYQPDLDLSVSDEVALRSEHFSTWLIHGFNYILGINNYIFHKDSRAGCYWNEEVCLTCGGN